VLYNLFRLFLVHKISIYAFIYENRKKNGKKKRKRISLLTKPGGNFGPARARARAATRAGGPTRPASGSGAADGAVGAGPRASEGGRMALGGDGGGGGFGREENRPPEFDDGSPPVIRFRVVGSVAKHGWG
jgi:hypothetical protein